MQDSLETAAYFPTAVYSISKPEFVAPALTVFNELIAKRCNKKASNKLYPSHMTPNMFMDPRVKDLATYIAGTAWNILDAQGHNLENQITYFLSLWGQEHHYSSSMDEHVHNLGTQIVGFYILDAPEKSSRLVVHDPRPGRVQINLPEKSSNEATYASAMVSFPLETGKLYFTNAWLPHSFTRHANTTKPLKFLHFNLGVQHVPHAPQKEEGPVIV